MYTLGSLTASNYQLTAHPYHEVSVFCAKAAHIQMDNLPTRLWMSYLYLNSKLYEIKAKPCSQAKHIFFPLKLLLRLGDYQACRRYTFQEVHTAQQIPRGHTVGLKRCCHCSMAADAQTLQGGVWLLPRCSGQQILLARSRIPPREGNELKRKVLQINLSERRCKITNATIKQELEVMH